MMCNTCGFDRAVCQGDHGPGPVPEIEISEGNLQWAVVNACRWSSPNPKITHDISAEVGKLLRCKKNLRALLESYDNTPISHRPSRDEIISALRAVLDGD